MKNSEVLLEANQEIGIEEAQGKLNILCSYLVTRMMSKTVDHKP
jgi:hypothetical protein